MNHNASSRSANAWQSLTLREAGVSLLDCVHKTPVAAPFGYPYIAIPQIKNGRIELSDVRRISESDFEEWTRKTKPCAFDVVLSRRCNPGETAHVPEGLECALGQNLVLLRSDGSKVYQPFLRWLVRGPEWWEQIGRFLNVGAVFDSLKCANIPNFRLSIPPHREQERIADILGTLDDKIALNWRMNETLEAMARRLFKSWFVNFDPVHAKAALRRQHPKLSNAELSRRALPNLDPKIAELFPDSFEDSPLGPIPKGWRFQTIGDQVSLQRGKTYKSALKDQSGPVLLGLASIERNGGFRRAKLTTYGGDSPDVLLVYPDELYVSLKDVTQSADLLGAVARLPSDITVGRLTQDTVKLIFQNATASREILYRTLLTHDYRDYCRNHATGTTNLGLSREDFLAYPIICPTEDITAFYELMSSTMRVQCAAFDSEMKQVETLRDKLLPRLLSGELSVEEVV